MYLPTSARMTSHALVLVSVSFLMFYSRLVCPFVNDLALMQLVGGLAWVMVFQLITRELLLRRLQASDRFSLPRRAFFVSVATWFAAGILAFIVHHLRYPEFPPASHLKLMTGYWGLGAGLLAQLEYVIYERALVGQGTPLTSRNERLALRLLEGFAVFTAVPALVMVLLVARYIYEDLIIPGVAGEIMYLSGFFVVVALTVAWLWGRTLQEDTDQIVRGLRLIENGEFDSKLESRRNDELGLVSAGINQMANGLAQRERMREAFGRFVSPEVAERFINEYVQDGKELKLGGQRRRVAILVCDIRDFTPLCESLDPEQLTELLNHYFSVQVDAIQRHGGLVDKFMGDAIMAVFGHLDSDANPARNAIEAALAMREALAEFNAEFAGHPGTPVNNGIGIHIGEVVAGYFGSPNRLEFTVMGQTVNIASRIESCCKPPNPPLLISEAVVDESGIECREVGDFALKGVSQAMRLFTPTAVESDSLDQSAA